VIALAADHGGFEIKEAIKKHLISQGVEVKDFGTDSTESVDYPIYAEKAARAVANKECTLGIICCGTGIGVSMVANKYQNVRCALCWEEEIAQLAKQHNNANIISLPARFISKEKALSIVDAYLNTEFEGGRHSRRVDIINDYDNNR
jgi:ribose 5-phosphate isomerase B